MSVRAISHFYSAPDGLRLHVREHPAIYDAGHTPVVCLPGLTRGAADFDVVARWLAESSAMPRRVIAFDYRGRGLSEHDRDWRHYDFATERSDFLMWLCEKNIDAMHFIGTSRGGLHVIALATTNRKMIRGVVLNDVGPVLEPEGLLRIKGYVGAAAAPASINEAVAMLKRGSGLHFSGLSSDEWRMFATTTFGSDATDLRLRYDPSLARTLDGFDLTKPLPDLWDQFDALHGAPLLAIRGEHSDLLSDKILTAMTERWPGCEAFTVLGQAHAPLLADAPTIARIDSFLAAADRA